MLFLSPRWGGVGPKRPDDSNGGQCDPSHGLVKQQGVEAAGQMEEEVEAEKDLNSNDGDDVNVVSQAHGDEPKAPSNYTFELPSPRSKKHYLLAYLQKL